MNLHREISVIILLFVIPVSGALHCSFTTVKQFKTAARVIYRSLPALSVRFEHSRGLHASAQSKAFTAIIKSSSHEKTEASSLVSFAPVLTWSSCKSLFQVQNLILYGRPSILPNGLSLVAPPSLMHCSPVKVLPDVSTRIYEDFIFSTVDLP